MRAWIELSKLWIRRQPAHRLFVMGFFLLIMMGTLLLLLPFATENGKPLSFLDALFTATSAVCVTGLTVANTGSAFTFFGRMVIMALVQIGGLGIAFAGAAIFLLAGKRIGFKSRLLVKEALNIENTKGLITLVKNIACITFCFELLGAVASFTVFIQDYSFAKALEVSVFHSIAAFCNAGLDILGGIDSLAAYADNVPLNMITAILVSFGGIGYLVILDILKKKTLRKLSLHSKIVIATSVCLTLFGTLLLWWTEKSSLLSALFHSVSARTAGFSTSSLAEFSSAGLFALVILMFIGASPGSTGGGIKTSTFFVVICSAKSYIANQPCTAFKRKISDDIVLKSFVLCFLSLLLVCAGTGLIIGLEPQYSFMQVLFEAVSAFGTVGLSTGITPYLGASAKLILILLMFVGRVGILTVASAWIYRPPAKAAYSQEYISIG